MKTAEIYALLDSISPFELQEGWDNSGLLVGAMDREVRRIVVALDIDEEMIESYEEETLFLLHHPLIFSPLKSISMENYPANIVEKLILKRDSLIAMHTNFDKTHLNRYVFRDILGLQWEKEKDFVLEAGVDWSLEELLGILTQAFGCESFRVVNPKERIESLALTTGAGASLMESVEADCFLTGDIKYHDAMKAESINLMMVDIGHWESERFFAEIIGKELKKLPISVIIAQSKNPFVTYRNIQRVAPTQ